MNEAMEKSAKMIGQIASVIVLSIALGLLVNGIRKDGVPLIMPFPPEYRCADEMTEGRAIAAKEALRQHGREGTVFVDARPTESYEKGHIQGAINLPYSFVRSVPPEAIELLRKERRIIVYCNSESAERSNLMAGELSEAGLNDVAYLLGGFLGWVKAGGAYTGQKPEGYD